MLDYALLEALAHVISEGSFERAARRLAITPSAVSQRVRLLEDRVGTALVVRGQPCVATPAGRRLFRHAGEVALLEDSLREDFAQLLPADDLPTVRIAVNADSLATWFMPALATIGNRLFELVIDDEDHTAEWLRRGEVMAAVATSAGPIAGCSSRPLGSLAYEATASPAFIARWFGEGVSEEALTRAPSLLFNRKDRLQDRWVEGLFQRSRPRPAHILPSTQGFVDATLAGIGWGMNPKPLVAEHRKAGRLAALDDTGLSVPLYWHWSRAIEPALSELNAAVLRQARSALVQDGAKPAG